MNFMGLWAILAGLGIGSILRIVYTTVLAWNRHTRMLIWSARTVTAVLLVAFFWETVQLRDYAVEDETISRLAPALSAMKYVSLAGAEPRYVVTMEPLVIQMYAPKTTQIVDLEAVDSGTLQKLRSPGANSRLIFVKETERLSVDDLNRYGDQVRYMLSLPSTGLQSNGRFQILGINR
jgi:hypothetical protein